MVKTVVSVDLPVDEKLTIKKNSIVGTGGAPSMPTSLPNQAKRFSLVTGIHGDELEGQAVCYEVQRRIAEQPQNFCGTLDIYPSLNPLGMDCVTRGIPAFDLDMNRTFPGDNDGTMTEYIASKILEDIKGSDFALDVHASSIFVREIPQVRIPPQFKDQTLELAKTLNMDLVWVQRSVSVQENSLVYTLNQSGTPCVVIDIGLGMTCNPSHTAQLTDGIFCLLKKLGMWTGETITPKAPLYCDEPERITEIVAQHAGFFMKKALCGQPVEQGQTIGLIIDPLEGKIIEEIKSPASGILFTLREYPILEIGSTLGRVLK